jgi:hypothetical protein
MTHGSDPQSMLAAAQEAAGAGDYASAERLLREALALQEARLGPDHPDLAHTHNNLAVVCERLEKFGEAERGYRRAHAIAVASLPPRHPFVATSLRNLVDFCVARGIPLYTPPAARPADATPPAPVPPPTGPAIAPDARDGLLAFARGGVVRHALAAAALVAMAVAALLFTAPWERRSNSAEPSVEDPRGAAQPADAPAAPLPPLPDLEPPSSTPQLPSATPSPGTTGAEASTGIGDSGPAGGGEPSTPITVLNAQICSAFDRRGSPDWECTPVRGSGEPGAFTFYTRLRTDADTTVEHRWYREGRLHQSVTLSVGANPGTGFRTYSRVTVSPEGAGSWRAELRASDGTRLHEASFVVR